MVRQSDSPSTGPNIVRASDILGTFDFPAQGPTLRELLGHKVHVYRVSFEDNQFNAPGPDGERDPNKADRAVVFLVKIPDMADSYAPDTVYRIKQSSWRNVRFGEAVKALLDAGKAEAIEADVVEYRATNAPGKPLAYTLQ